MSTWESEMTKEEYQDLLDKQQLEIERLTIENKLLRSASENQRELNGNLRIELQDMVDKFANDKFANFSSPFI